MEKFPDITLFKATVFSTGAFLAFRQKLLTESAAHEDPIDVSLRRVMPQMVDNVDAIGKIADMAAPFHE
jgi:hypothetical protein